ncbi:MAG TPA: sugar ABC transporter substrate-binding protein [Candidatus Limnocylindrales bacterium]|nr:sugar ABC transporter substrate-binding protein [Candidatus Limnocylindrales bacterium]
MSAGGALSGSIRYVLWDANQLPVYKSCADVFMSANPGTHVNVEQVGWDDYWNSLTTGFVSGDVPDVFTDHLNKYPEYANAGQIVPLNDRIAQDGVSTDIYFEGLADLWVAPDGKRYGLPKDWDTIAFAYNAEMAEAAGVDIASLGSLTWNPQDGGTFEKLIAHLSIDKDGVRGDEPGFDPKNVQTFGLGINNSGGAVGQLEYSFWPLSTGWTYTDKPVWGTRYNYDDQRYIDFFKWWRRMIEKGYAPTYEEVSSGVGYTTQFGSGRYAVISAGSWMIGDVLNSGAPKVGWFPTPIGPSGKRASIFNGLADSIPTAAKNPELAWAWLKFMASPDCQNLVGNSAVVFPAIKEAADRARETRAAQGVDVSAFTVHVDEGTTSLFPITDHASDIAAIMQPVTDAILLGQADPETALRQANAEVNALFGQ